MAKKRDEFDFEDFDLDNFDFDIPDFDSQMNEKDDRKAVTKLSSGFFKGVKETATSPATLTRLMRLSLPRGYAQAFNVADAAGESARELYNSAVDDLRPAADVIRRTSDKILPKVQSKLPNFLAKQLDKLGFGDDYTPTSASKLKEDYQNGEIAGVLADLFKAQGAAQTEITARQDTDQLVRNQIEDNQHKDQIGQLNVIARGVSRLAGYQDQVLIKYQQKSLELQYRHFFVAKDLLDITNVQNEKVMGALDKVIKNTGLPDAIKLQKSELAEQMLKQRLISGSLNTISNWTSNYRKQLTDNLKGLVSGVLSPVSMTSILGQEGMGDGTTNAGATVGSAIADWGGDQLSYLAQPYIERNPFLRKSSAFLSRNLTGIPQRLDRWAKSETKGYGYGASITQGIKDLLPKYYLNDRVGNNQLMDADQPAIWNRQSHRTLNEVIPAYLAQINRWTKATATGELDKDVETYNLTRGGFTSRGAYLKDIGKQVLTPAENRTMRTEIDYYIQNLDRNSNLSEDGRKNLRRQITGDLAKGEYFDLNRYSKREAYDSRLSDEQVDELRYFFRNEFGLDADGKMEDNSLDNQDRVNDLAQTFDRLQTLIPASGDRVRAFADIVGMDALREMGLVERQGTRDRINFDKIWDMVLDDSAAAGGVAPQAKIAVKEERDTRSLKERLQAAAHERLVKQRNEDLSGGTDSEDVRETISLPQRIAQQAQLPAVQPQIVQSTVDFDPYLGEHSLIIQELRNTRDYLRSQGQEQSDYRERELAALGEIFTYLQGRDAGRAAGSAEAGGDAPGEARRKGGLLSQGLVRGRKAAWWVGKKYAQGVAAVYKGAAEAGKFVGGAGVQGVLATGRGLFGRGRAYLDDKLEAADVYVKGSFVPALRKRLLEAGEYIDATTGKVITSYGDIKGEVRDKAGNIILSAEDFAKGLYNTHGRSLFSRMTSLAKRGAIAYGRFSTLPLRGVLAGIKLGAEGLVTRLQSLKDGYLKGENKPRILARVMDEGGYYDQATRQVIKTYGDIRGTVVDRWGNVVVTAEELGKSGGFLDTTGKRIRAATGDLLTGAGRLLGQAATLPVKLLAGAGTLAGRGLRKLGGLFRRGRRGVESFRFSGNETDDLLVLNYQQLSALEKIHAILDGQFNRKVAGDIDGDGIRENSWQDRLRKRMQGKEKDAALKAENASRGGGIGGLLAGLSGKLSGLFKKKDEEDDEGGGWLEDAADVADIADSVGDARERRRNRKAGKLGKAERAAQKAAKEGSKKAGWLKKGWDVTKRYALPVGSFIGRQVLLRGAIMAGTALAAVISAPVALGALGVATAGAVGYGIYRFVKDKPSAIQGYRMAQYGINPRSQDQTAQMLKLEALLMGNVSYGQDGTAQLGQGIQADQLLTIFGLDVRSDETRLQRWAQWFGRRFKPVFLTHMAAVNRFAKGVSLLEIDDKLPIQSGMDYLGATRLDTMGEVFNDVANSPFDSELKSDADDVASWIKDAQSALSERLAKAPLNGDTAQAKTDLLGKTAASGALLGAGSAAAAAAEARRNRATGQGPNDLVVPPQSRFQEALSGSESLLGKAARFTAALLGGPAGLWAANKVMGDPAQSMQLSRQSLDTASVVRYKVYGLKEMDIDKVRVLQTLENHLFKDVRYNPDKSAYYSGDTESLFPLFAGKFGVDNSDAQAKADWFVWLRFRLLPAFLQYCGGVRSKLAIDAKDAAAKLKPDELKDVLNHMSEATSTFKDEQVSVWTVSTSPWPGYELNTNPATIVGNLNTLKTPEGRENKYSEQYANLITPKPAGTPSASNPMKSTFDNAPSPLKGYADGSITQRPGQVILQRTKDAYAPKAPGQAAGVSSPGGLLTGEGVSGGQAMVEQPGGGTGGDINQIPQPTGDGWAGVKDTIIAAANMAGFDPATAATTAAIESSFKPNVKAGTSSATGLFQFISGTWKQMLNQYADKYGINPNTPPTDARANALMGMEFLKDNANILKNKIGRAVTDTDLYLAHFLGPAGAVKFLTAPPQDPATQHVGANVPKANASIFFANGRPRTVGEVYQEMNRRLDKGRKMHDLQSGQSYNSVAGDSSSGDTNTDYASGGFGKQGDVSKALSSQPAANDDAPPMGGAGGNVPVTADAGATPSTPTAQLGGRAAAVVAQGKEQASAQGIQAGTGGSLATPTAPEVSGPTPLQQAAMASKQSSIENTSLVTSMDSVSSVLKDQLDVQKAMRDFLESIEKNTREAKGGGQSAAAAPAAAATPEAPPLLRPMAQAAPRSPISVKRTG